MLLAIWISLSCNEQSNLFKTCHHLQLNGVCKASWVLQSNTLTFADKIPS